MNLVHRMKEQGLTDVRDLHMVKDIPYGMNITETILWKHIKESEWENLFWELTHDEKFDSFFDGKFDALINLVGDDQEIDQIKAFLPLFRERFFKIYQEKRLRKDLLAYGDISIDSNSKNKFGKSYEVWHFPINNTDWITAMNDKTIRTVIRAYVCETPVDDIPNYLMAIKRCIGYMSEYYYKYLWNQPDNCLYPDIILCNRCNVQENLVRSLPVHLLRQKLKKSMADDEQVFCWAENHNYCVKQFNIAGVTYAFDFVYHWDATEPGWIVYLKRRGELPFTSVQIEKVKEFANPTNDPNCLIFKDKFIDTEGYTSQGSLETITIINDWVNRIQPILKEKFTSELNDDIEDSDSINLT